MSKFCTNTTTIKNANSSFFELKILTSFYLPNLWNYTTTIQKQTWSLKIEGQTENLFCNETHWNLSVSLNPSEIIKLTFHFSLLSDSEHLFFKQEEKQQEKERNEEKNEKYKISDLSFESTTKEINEWLAELTFPPANLTFENVKMCVY
jgi:hypothetical protein